MHNTSTINWNEIRALFPATKKYTYLNAACASPLSKIVVKEGKRYYDEMLKHGDEKWDEWQKRQEQIREKIAKYINADKDEIAFTINTSTGMNLIADIIQEKGDVITMNDEFPSSTYPWIHRKYKIKFVQPINNIYSMDGIQKVIDEKSKILVSSYVQYRTGFRQDLLALGQLCKSKNLIFVVNATQAIGAMPINVKKTGIDFLTFSCFKWTMSGYGIGIIYINKKWLQNIFIPVVGHYSVTNHDDFDNKNIIQKTTASSLEVGCPHFPNIFALGGAIDLLSSIGQKNIKERIFDLNNYLASKLTKLNIKIVSPLEEKYRSGITIIKVGNPKKIIDELYNKKIIVSQRGDGIRISIHIYNNKQDIDIFINELQKITK